MDEEPPSINGNFIPKKVGIIYSDVKREYFPTNAQYVTEKKAREDAEAVAKYLVKLGIKPSFYPANSKLPKLLQLDKPNMVMNLVGSVKGSEFLASTIPALLELLEIPYTGSGILGESISYNKFLVNDLLQQNGIPVPRFQLFNTWSDPIDTQLRFPLISKLNEIHGAVEITYDAVSENEKHLRDRLKRLIKIYDQPILVEEFIVGKEIAAYILEGKNRKVYLAERIVHPKKEMKYLFTSFETLWQNYSGVSYKKYDDNVLKAYARKAFEIMSMADYGKFDIRVDSSGRYFFLDSNSNPFFGPKESEASISYVLELYGISFMEILKRLITNTMRDFKGKTKLPFPKEKHKI